LDRNNAFFGEGCFELPGDRGLNRRRRTLDELADFFQLVEGALAVDTQLSRDFMYAWFSRHNSPV
jgi:hypothetical protein